MSISYLILLLLIIDTIPLIICFLKAGAYKEYVSAIKKEDFFASSLYGLGFALIEILKIDFKSSAVHRIREQAGILFGRKYADFYVRVIYAQTLTYVIIFSYLFLFIGCVLGGPEGIIVVAVGIITEVVIYRYYINNYERKINELNIIYMRDFPNAVSTIALLVNGGMFLRDAWKEVAYSSEEPLYKQMQGVVDDMNNGVSESDAIFRFANRCSTKEIRKFSTLITQAIEKGGRDLADSLVKQADLLINEKRQLVLQEGEKASNKLMFPIAMIFVGVLVMVMIPVLTNMSM